MSERDTTERGEPTDPRDPRDHALALLLEERLGHGPPDLSQSILARVHAAPRTANASAEPLHDRAEAAMGERELVGAGVGEPTFEAREAAVSVGEAPTTERFRRQFGLLGEVCSFMAAHSKWWLTPIWIVVAIVGLALIVGSTGAAPFIYTMF